MSSLKTPKLPFRKTNRPCTQVGELLHNARLDYEKVTAIRVNKDNLTDPQYADLYDVSISTIYKARVGISWRSCPTKPRLDVTDYVRPKGKDARPKWPPHLTPLRTPAPRNTGS